MRTAAVVLIVVALLAGSATCVLPEAAAAGSVGVPAARAALSPDGTGLAHHDVNHCDRQTPARVAPSPSADGAAPGPARLLPPFTLVRVSAPAAAGLPPRVGSPHPAPLRL